ncbi:DUF998 domain-containing protein [Microtetraspora sp. NBRC 13810]|uniref:DUF998 domain-containing protein n=1 Tax=Microtetraspora sp. NBRC 13810 TaxID=3030990 RepID=UPI002555A31C|nr:DUF998 domain-containing protein [Microtetraspora sp. NBRC 13810]
MVDLRRLYPLLAGAGIAIAATVTAVDLAGPHPDLVDLTISDYAAMDRGGTAGLAMVVLGMAALALVAGMRAAGAPSRGAPERLVALWGLVLTVSPLTLLLGVAAHRWVLLAAFAGLPVAAALLVVRFAADDRWRIVARAVEWLALAGGFGLLAITYAALPGDGVLIGLAEWSLLGVEVALLGVLAVRVAQLTWTRAADTADGTAEMMTTRSVIPAIPVLSSRRS